MSNAELIQRILEQNEKLISLLHPENNAKAAEPKSKRKRGRPRKKPLITDPKTLEKEVKNIDASDRRVMDSSIENFIVKERIEKPKRYTPVKGGKNMWVDDGSDDETKELEDGAITPKIKLSEKGVRTKPAKVKVMCGQDENGKKREDDGCGKTLEVYPEYAIEYFICEDCLNKKRRGR